METNNEVKVTIKSKDPMWKNILLGTVGMCSSFVVGTALRSVVPVLPSGFIKKLAFKIGGLAISETVALICGTTINKEILAPIESEVKTIKEIIEKTGKDDEATVIIED